MMQNVGSRDILILNSLLCLGFSFQNESFVLDLWPLRELAQSLDVSSFIHIEWLESCVEKTIC